MRTPALLLAALLAGPVVHAQAPQPPAPRPVLERETLDPRKNQKIERIVIEDAGNRIDELRVGGQTQSVRVQPKADVPAYEMLPDDLARSRPADRREGLSGGNRRVWNIGNF